MELHAPAATEADIVQSWDSRARVGFQYGKLTYIDTFGIRKELDTWKNTKCDLIQDKGMHTNAIERA